jgi:hypothetical protein
MADSKRSDSDSAQPPTKRVSPGPDDAGGADAQFASMRNTTPHDVVIFPRDGDKELYRVVKQSVNKQLRLTSSEPPVEWQLGEVRIRRQPNYDGLSGELPPPGTALIVSTMVADWMMKPTSMHPELDVPIAGQYEVYVPDSNPGMAVRDAGGQIVGVRGLIAYRPETTIRFHGGSVIGSM